MRTRRLVAAGAVLIVLVGAAVTGLQVYRVQPHATLVAPAGR